MAVTIQQAADILFERIISLHREWDIPLEQFYRLQERAIIHS